MLTGQEQVEQLQLDLSDVEFLLQVSEECDRCFVPSSYGYWVGLRVADGQCQVLQTSVKRQIEPMAYQFALIS